jgi:hypothetical protein
MSVQANARMVPALDVARTETPEERKAWALRLIEILTPLAALDAQTTPSPTPSHPAPADPTTVAYLHGEAWGESTGYASIVDGNAGAAPSSAPAPTAPAPDTETCPMCAEQVPRAQMQHWRSSPSMIGFDVGVYSCTDCRNRCDGAPLLAKGAESTVRESGFFRRVQVTRYARRHGRKRLALTRGQKAFILAVRDLVQSHAEARLKVKRNERGHLVLTVTVESPHLL